MFGKMQRIEELLYDLQSEIKTMREQQERLAKAVGNVPGHVRDQMNIQYKLKRKEDLQMLEAALASIKEESNE